MGDFSGHSRRGTQPKEPVVSLVGVVDDDESVREAVSSLLRSAGYRCSVFPSAKAFLASDTLEATDCMVLDVRMPEVTGPELQSKLRAMNSAVPVIFVTAHADDEVRARASLGGATAFLNKPFSEDALLDAIRSALNGELS
ncbi:MAG TPA: response regulator [Bryobacteraceae bacterium]